MTATDLRTHAEEIQEQFSDQLDLTVEDVEERLDTLVNEYKVPTSEARRSVINTYLDEAGMDRDQFGGGGNERKQVGDIDAAEEWIDLKAKVVDLWDPRSDAVAQVDPLLGGVDVADLLALVAAAAELVAVHPGIVQVGVDDAPAGLGGGHLVLVDQRIESLSDVVDVDVELV